MLGVHGNGRLELAHGFVNLSLPAVEEAELESKAEGQRIDGDPALEVRDRLVDVSPLVRVDGLLQRLIHVVASLGRAIGPGGGRRGRAESRLDSRKYVLE